MKLPIALASILILLPLSAARGEKENPAPPFSLRTPAGVEKSIQDFRGKVVVMEFFASWCPSCQEAVADLNLLQEQFPNQLEIIAVSTAEDDPHGLSEFIETHKPKYTILVDANDRVARSYRVVGYPSYFVLDRNGNIQAQRMGNVNWNGEKSVQFLQKLLAEVPSGIPGGPGLPVTAPPEAVTMATR